MIVNVTPPIHTYANEINVSSYSAIVMDQKTGRVFFEKNAHEKGKSPVLQKS